jgi:hypothetical protein
MYALVCEVGRESGIVDLRQKRGAIEELFRDFLSLQDPFSGIGVLGRSGG